MVNSPLLTAGTGSRTVIDQTGLNGKYDFTLKWSSEFAATGQPSDEPSLLTAIQEQLGLKLVPTKGPVEVIVIDHIEKPTVDGAEVAPTSQILAPMPSFEAATIKHPVAATAHQVRPDLARASQPSAAPQVAVETLSDTKGTQLNSYFRTFGPELRQSFSRSLGVGDANSVGPQEANLLLTITPNGNLSELRLESGTQDSPITRAAWEAVKNTKYPPLPSGLGGSDLKLRMHFATH